MAARGSIVGGSSVRIAGQKGKWAVQRGEYIGWVFLPLLQGFVRHLPSRCAVCHAWPSQPVCEACVGAFAQPHPRCRTCALQVLAGIQQCGACTVSAPPLDACLSALTYGYPWSTLIADFKFHQQPGWARSFAVLLRSAPWVEPALEAADWLIPMPLSAQRLRERGYNQAHELAKALEPAKVVHRVLLRTVDTAPQRTLPRAERLRSLEHAFTVDPLQYPTVRGKRVVVLDDVMTTGASLHAAARVLRAAGAAHITGLVLARTE